MNIQISNQKPALLYSASKVLPNIPVITDESTYNSDRHDAISKMMVEPIFESIVPSCFISWSSSVEQFSLLFIIFIALFDPVILFSTQ